ncbi:MAG: hypothetical protein ABIJ42_10650 [Acidobacteriota bacterium]
MKKISNVLRLISMAVLLCSGYALAESNIDWIPITGNEHNMIVRGYIDAAGLDFSKAEYLLFSFGPKGNEDCRSMSPINQDGSFYATIRGDVFGETLNFKVLSSSNEDVFEIEDVIIFEPDSTIENLHFK